MRRRFVLAALCWLSAGAALSDPASETMPLRAISSLDVEQYMGTWYQVAWFPNRFQRQCISDTAAIYRLLPAGRIEVTNRCKSEGGATDEVVGLAKPAGSQLRGIRLEPATLEVSFLPAALRWLPIWGDYWVIQLADDGRYAVVSEPKREFLWVLSRTPMLKSADETAIRSRLLEQGFELSRWQPHRHTSQPAAAR